MLLDLSNGLCVKTGRVDILDGAQDIVRSGQPDARIILDPVVDLLEMVGALAADLQHEVKLAGQIVAGDDVRILVDVIDELIVVPWVLHPDFHENRDVVAKLGIVRDHRIGFDQAGLLHLFDAFDDG